MKLITKEIAKSLPALYANENLSADQVKVPLKLFNPTGPGTWYVTEYDPSEELGFGYVDLGMGPGCAELGYISIAELRSLRLPLGLTIERDLHWNPETTLKAVMDGDKR